MVSERESDPLGRREQVRSSDDSLLSQGLELTSLLGRGSGKGEGLGATHRVEKISCWVFYDSNCRMKIIRFVNGGPPPKSSNLVPESAQAAVTTISQIATA